jgi:putative Holliday junction resolvase
MRAIAFDVGAKRTGVAVSDPSGTLARPHSCLACADPLPRALALVATLQADEDGLEVVVVGLPRRLDGTEHAQTVRARAFAAALAARTGVPVVLQDERLTSVEADERLAARERDWRVRKARLDAAAAAIVLQDYLDERARERAGASLSVDPAAPHDPR